MNAWQDTKSSLQYKSNSASPTVHRSVLEIQKSVMDTDREVIICSPMGASKHKTGKYQKKKVLESRIKC